MDQSLALLFLPWLWRLLFVWIMPDMKVLYRILTAHFYQLIRKEDHSLMTQKKITVKEVRRQVALSQEGTTPALVVSFATINPWENGKMVPSKLEQRQFKQFCAQGKQQGARRAKGARKGQAHRRRSHGDEKWRHRRGAPRGVTVDDTLKPGRGAGWSAGYHDETVGSKARKYLPWWAMMATVNLLDCCLTGKTGLRKAETAPRDGFATPSTHGG